MSNRCLLSIASLFILSTLLSCAGTSKTPPRAAGPQGVVKGSSPTEIIDGILANLAASADACGRGEAEGCTRILRHTVNGASAAARTAYATAFEAGCDRGVPAACGGWGMAHIWQRGAPRDVEKGLSLLERGCDGGSADSCVLLAEAQGPQNYYNIKPNPEGARSVLTRACEDLGGSPCLGLSQYYREDMKKADELIRRACSTGSSRACYALAEFTMVQLKDHAGAKTFLGLACENLLGDACHDMAWQHVSRTIEKTSKETAIELFARSCALGDGAGCDFLAKTNHGATIYDDDNKKEPHWEAAKLQDDDYLTINRRYCSYEGGESCFNLAYKLAWLEGETDVTAEEIVVSLQSACNAGTIGGCNILGHVSKDFIRLCEQTKPGDDTATGKDDEVPAGAQSATRYLGAIEGAIHATISGAPWEALCSGKAWVSIDAEGVAKGDYTCNATALQLPVEGSFTNPAVPGSTPGQSMKMGDRSAALEEATQETSAKAAQVLEGEATVVLKWDEQDGVPAVGVEVEGSVPGLTGSELPASIKFSGVMTVKEAEEWMVERRQAETRTGCAFAGFSYLYGVQIPRLNGRSVAADRDVALEALQRSCDAGSSPVCARLEELRK